MSPLKALNGYILLVVFVSYSILKIDLERKICGNFPGEVIDKSSSFNIVACGRFSKALEK